jgi:hypothetical protein
MHASNHTIRAAVATAVPLCEGAMPKEKMMDDTDIGKYLTNMKAYDFWRLVREHRMDDIGKFLERMKPYEFWKLARKHHFWLTTAEAAEYLGMKSRTLVSWRALGTGPRPVQMRKGFRYHLDVLDAWTTAKILLSSGSGGRSVAPPTAPV